MVKSDHIRKSQANDFLLFGFKLQTSRSNTKQVIGTFKFVYPCLTFVGPRLNLTTSEDSRPMISCRLVSHTKPLGPIIREI